MPAVALSIWPSVPGRGLLSYAQTKLTGATASVGVTVMLPSLPPAQVGSVWVSVAPRTQSAPRTVAEQEAVQPLASVTSTVKVPALRPGRVKAGPLPLRLMTESRTVTVKGATPPVTVTSMEPSLPLGVWTGLPVQSVRVRAGRSATVPVRTMVQPTSSVTVRE